MTDNAELLRAAMDAQGITDPELRAGIAAIAGGESALTPKPEASYAHTSNDRIREVFKRLGDLPDDELDDAKADPKEWFELVYGGDWGATNLGNTQPGDGYKFRGRGLFQLTGRSNYARYGRLVGVDLIRNPDKANDPRIAAAIAVAYMKDRYHGGGWDGMKRAVGASIGNVDAEKNALFESYLASGEFAHSAEQQITGMGEEDDQAPTTFWGWLKRKVFRS